MRIYMFIWIGLLGLVCVSPAAGQSDSSASTQPAEEPEATPPPPKWFQLNRMTGDWGGVRTALEDSGFTINAFSNHYYGFNLHGGRDTNNAHRYSTSYDITFHADLEKMGLIDNGEVFVFLQGWKGRHRNINSKVGALSDPFDDADGRKFLYVDQFWYQHSFLNRRLKFRFGRLDFQGLVDRNAYANSEDKQFMNTSLDNNNVAAVPLPIGNGAVVLYDPLDWLGFVVGVADGDANAFDDGFHSTFHDRGDFFAYAQTDLRIKLESERGVLPGNYRFGMVYDPRRKVVFERRIPGSFRDPEFKRGDYGFYLSCDQMLYREQPEDMQGLGVFFRYGLRNGEVNRLKHSWSAGLQYQGLLPDRDEDVLGFGSYGLHSSAAYRHRVDNDFRGETGFELYYQIQINKWLTLTPDVQYIINPGGLDTTPDSIVMGFRLRVTL